MSGKALALRGKQGADLGGKFRVSAEIKGVCAGLGRNHCKFDCKEWGVSG